MWNSPNVHLATELADVNPAAVFDLPQQLQPFQEGRVEGVAPPSRGVWRAGSIVFNRRAWDSNVSSTQQPVGWVCVTPGRPGIWKNLSLTMKNDDIQAALGTRAVLTFSAPFELGRSPVGGRLWQPYCRRLNQTAAKLPPPLPLPPSVPPTPPAPPPPPPPPPSPFSAASWLVETAARSDDATVGSRDRLCGSPCIFRSATDYTLPAFANVLDANTYSGDENASNVCAGPHNKNYANQVWRRVGNMLQTHAFGLPFCLAGVLLTAHDVAGDTSRRPPLRNMSVVVETCNNSSAAQNWSLDAHTQDSLLSIRWNGGRGGTELCVTVVSATSPDIPGGAQDVRLEPCPSHSGDHQETSVDASTAGAIYCQAEVCEDGAHDAWPAQSFLSIDDGKTFQLMGEIETYGPTSFASPLGDGATAVLPYVVFAEPDRRAVVCNATAYSLRSDGMLENYSFPVRLSGFPKPILVNAACNGHTCVNWWARRAVTLPNGDLLTMLGNLQFEPNASLVRPGERNLYSVASVVSSDGGRNWEFQTEIRTESCIGTGPCAGDQVAHSQVEGPNEVDVITLGDGSLLTVYRVSSPGPYFQSRSTTGGQIWSPPAEMPGCHSVDPSLELVTVNGAEVVLLSGGRPGLFMHASLDGGRSWSTWNILANHNALTSKPELRYPTWAVDILASQQGETDDGTSGYTSLVATVDGDNGAIVCYDKMSTQNQDRVFCMRVKVDIVGTDSDDADRQRLKSDDSLELPSAKTDVDRPVYQNAHLGSTSAQDSTSPCTSPCAQCPRRSDVVLSSRWVHYSSVGGPYDTWGAVEAFNATRIDWVYTSNRSFVETAASAHGLSVTPATNANVPDDGDDRCNDQHTQPKSCNWSVGRVLNIDGLPLSSPPGVFRRVAHGCVNSPEYMKIALSFVDKLKLTGARAIQHDDASMNDESVQWSGGNLSASGCYCSHCMAKFTTSLLKLNSSAASKLRAQYNVTTDWNYRDWLFFARPIATPHSTPDHSTLRDAFVEFQLASTEEYVHTLRSHLEADKSDSPTTMSANNGGSWASPYHLFDYGIGELELNIGTQMTLLRRLHALFVADVPAGKQQVLTMPKGLELKEWLTLQGAAIVRATIAVSYALGGHILVPWDAEFSGGRYYGNASQYGDLFSFVRRHASMFDDANLLQTGWLPPAMTEHCAENFQASPVTLMGTVSATIPAGLRECQSVCDMLAAENASRCIGVRLQDRPNTQPASVGECALVAAGATALPRDSTVEQPVRVYKRLGAPATSVSEFSGRVVRVNDPQVMAIARSSSSGVGPLLIHLVDSRALAELGCCPSAYKPSFGYHPSNCSPCTASNCSGDTGLSCCRCKHTPTPPALKPSLELVLTAHVAAGACPKLVRAQNLDPRDDRVVADIRCDTAQKETRFTVSPPPQPWAMLEVHF